jgi:hypothetical protein
MSVLLDTLDTDQWHLLDVVWRAFIGDPQARWPCFSYVDFQMRIRGLDAFSVMSGLPAIGKALYHGGYRAAWSATPGGPPNDDNAVYLTMAGLFRISDTRAGAIGAAVLAYLRQLTQAREAFGASPFEVPNVNVRLSDALKAEAIDEDVLPWATAIVEHEWPGMRVVRQPGRHDASGGLGLLREADFGSVEEYLVAITAATTPQLPPAVLEYRDPRALLRTIDHFDVTCELVLGQKLVSKPAMARSALLAQDAHSDSDLQSGLSALGELLSELQVPGKRPTYATGRLLAWLAGKLPDLDQAAQARVRDAIGLLDAVRQIRNSGQHPKPSKELIQAHELLGLPFPIQDPGSAWDVIRAQMDAAFGMLQEEILAAR